jgi:hypothetical protein
VTAQVRRKTDALSSTSSSTGIMHNIGRIIARCGWHMGAVSTMVHSVVLESKLFPCKCRLKDEIWNCFKRKSRKEKQLNKKKGDREGKKGVV